MDEIKFNHKIESLQGALGIKDERANKIAEDVIAYHNKIEAVPSMDIAIAIKIGSNDVERCFLMYYLGRCNG